MRSVTLCDPLKLTACNALRPDPLLTVSEWSDQYRILTQKASAEAGRWRTSRTPYLKEIMDCLSAHSETEQIVMIKGAQIGGTECGLNWLGYIVDCCPGPVLLVNPTVDMAKRTSKQRIAPLFSDTPRLRAKVADSRARDSGNTLLLKEFEGGLLVMAGANSGVGLRSLPARYLFLDEIDAYPGDVDGEGDPVGLAIARSRTFARRKIFMVSTPTISGQSRIEAAYEESDQRKYFVPCPHCQGKQWLKWKQVKWPKGEPEKAHYECEHCVEPIYEHQKTEMLAQGEWISLNGPKGKVAGFHLSSLYSPLGWFSWADAALKWEKDCKYPERLREFVNTYLGESWKENSNAPDWLKLYDRRENYTLNSLPKGVLFLTAGADVQRDRIEVEIVGWGEGKESWSIDYRVFPGDPATDAPWKGLEQILGGHWTLSNGVDIPVQILAIDSAHASQLVYAWVRKFSMSKVIAIRGQQTSKYILSQPSAVDVTIRGRKLSRGTKVWNVGVDGLKSELYSWLRLKKPREDEPFPEGYCHFPQYSEEYFKQLTAEHEVTKIVRGYRRIFWEELRRRNEALDCRVYARAAAYLFGMDRYTEANWQELRDELGIKANP